MAIRQSSNAFRRLSDPAGSGVGDVETLAMAVRTAADAGATVVNISSVACLPADGSLDDGSLGAALAYAVDVKNVVVVAAAGNVGGPGQCHEQNPLPDPARPGIPDWDAVKVVASPSWYDDYVLTVGSVGPDGRPSGFSLAGPWVDVAAPGEAVRLPGPRRGGSDRYRARFLSARADFGDQLCRTGGHRHCRFDPVARAAAHRETGDATHRGHRPPPGGGVGCPGRTRCGRRTGGGERRRPRRITVDPDGDTVHRRPRRFGGPTRFPAGSRSAVPRHAWRSPWWHRRPQAGYDGGDHPSRTTDAASVLSSGPRGRAARIGHGAGAGNPVRPR